MLKDIVLLGVGALIGLAISMITAAAPLYFPNAPKWIWRWLFWGGIVIVFAMMANISILLSGGDDVHRSLSNLLFYDALLATIFVLIGIGYEVRINVEQKSFPLEIVFESDNPNKKFWSSEIWGTFDRPIHGIEYRLEIKNLSHNKTYKNVRVTADYISSKFTETAMLVFKRTDAQTLDMHPGDRELVKFFLFDGGPSIMDLEKIIVRVAADDTLGQEKIFYINSQLEPVISSDPKIRKISKKTSKDPPV